MNNPGTLILINGSSSSGKSTLLRAFQDYMHTEHNIDYWYFGTDIGFNMLPPITVSKWETAYLHFEIKTKDSKPYPIFKPTKSFLKYLLARYKAIKTFLDLGYNIIADEVVWSQEYIEYLTQVFQQSNIYLIKTFAENPILKNREKKRKDRPENLWKSSTDFSHINMHYDLEIDTSSMELTKICTQLKNLITTSQPKAIKNLKST
jgi:chloramphenicol 3-O phosphotransferase